MRASYWLLGLLLFLFFCLPRANRSYRTSPISLFFLAREQQLVYLKSFVYL